jgi:hypothetical protein
VFNGAPIRNLSSINYPNFNYYGTVKRKICHSSSNVLDSSLLQNLFKRSSTKNNYYNVNSIYQNPDNVYLVFYFLSVEYILMQYQYEIINGI